MLRESVGNLGVWVTLTGIAEIAIGVDVQIRGLAPWISTIAVVMLCCLFPANLKGAREHLTILREAGSVCRAPSAHPARVRRGAYRGGDQVFCDGSTHPLFGALR